MRTNFLSQLPRDPFDRVFVVALIAATVLTLLCYPFLPVSFPTHFGVGLRPDHFVDKPIGPFVMIVVAPVIYAILWPIRAAFRFAGLRVMEPAVAIVQVGLALLILVIHVFVCVWLIV